MLEQIKNIASLIRCKLGIEGDVEVGMILGSGLGEIADRIEVISTIPYSEVDGFPLSTVPGHSGRFVYGTLSGKRVIAMQGRVHYYEGYTMDQVSLPSRVLCLLGIGTLIVSNAAGGVNPEFNVGDVMIIEDHINLLPNPLIGPNMEELGTRFPELTTAYDRDLINLALSIDPTLKRGVYIASSGPSYETPAEYRFFHTIGADSCGMSTVPEVIVARHQGVRVFGLSLITNIGIGPNAGKATHQEVFEAATSATPRITRLVEQIVGRI